MLCKSALFDQIQITNQGIFKLQNIFSKHISCTGAFERALLQNENKTKYCLTKNYKTKNLKVKENMLAFESL